MPELAYLQQHPLQVPPAQLYPPPYSPHRPALHGTSLIENYAASSTSQSLYMPLFHPETKELSNFTFS